MRRNRESTSIRRNRSTTTKDALEIGCAQHIGKRGNQEDSFGLTDIYDNSLIGDAGIAAVVADGMGGLAFGKEASEIAVNTFKDVYTNKAITENISSALNRAAIAANDSVRDFSEKNGAYGNAGTTLIVAVIYEDLLYYISVGDSRIYYYHEGNLEIINIPHNYANTLRRRKIDGEITQETIDNDPEKECLTSYLGLDNIPEIDYNRIPIRLQSGDVVMLCSDGLFNTLEDREILDVLARQGAQPQLAADELVRRTIGKRQTYQDNVTTVIISKK